MRLNSRRFEFLTTWLASVISRIATAVWLVGVRGQLRRLDDGTVELWGNEFGLDEYGCVCNDAACYSRVH